MFSIFSTLFNVNNNSEITVQKIQEKNVEGFLTGPHALTSLNFKLNATISHYLSVKENSTCSVSRLYSRYYLMYQKKSRWLFDKKTKPTCLTYILKPD